MAHSARRRPSTVRRIAGARTATRGTVTPSHGPLRRLASKPVTWIVATVATAITSVLVTTLTSIPAQVLDRREFGDSVRGGDDVAVTVDEINDDDFYSVALPTRWDLPADDPIRTHVDSDTAAALVRSEQAAGASPVPYLRLRLVLEGRRNQKIKITNQEISDLQIGPPVRGTL